MAEPKETTNDTNKSSVCHKCQESIETPSFIQLGPYSFHKEHFVCFECEESLHGRKFHANKGKFYCFPDYERLFVVKCQGCDEKLTSGKIVTNALLDGSYHADCFACALCKRAFPDGMFFPHEGKPYCKQHYFSLQGKICAACGEPTVDKDVKRISDKMYHAKCLECAHCGSPFPQDSKIFPKADKLYCKSDFLKFFTKRCTACGEPIGKKMIQVNGEFYHPTCLKCSVCYQQMKKYTCVRGRLLCHDHRRTRIETPPKCSVCQQEIDKAESKVMMACGKKTHEKCFKCSYCDTALEKPLARLLDDKLCCEKCLLNPEINKPTKKDTKVSNIPITKTVNAAPRHHESKSVSKVRHAPTASLGGPIDINEKIIWQKGSLIGVGSFGKVYMAMNKKNGQLIAVKQVSFTNDGAQEMLEVQREIDLMKGLRHPHIVNFLQCEQVGKKLNILMEYVPGNSLDEVLSKFGPLDETVIQSYTRQLLAALAFVHQNNVVHRDIKAKNILVDTVGCVKLADFGSAKRFEANQGSDAPTMSYNYTPLWTAPEVLVGSYNYKVDIWSLGCVIIEMATAKEPWAECEFANPFRALYHIGNSTEIPKLPDNLSPTGTEFLKRCLTRNPENRPTARELMSDPWVKDVLFDYGTNVSTGSAIPSIPEDEFAANNAEDSD